MGPRRSVPHASRRPVGPPQIYQADSFLAYPPIQKHGVIGDRRTAALVAADGTMDWLCLPDYDSRPVFGALLDVHRGGWWRLGPSDIVLGEQQYLPHTALLLTTWRDPNYELELTDAMAWPEDERPPKRDAARVVIRRLRCLRGLAPCLMQWHLRDGFDQAPGEGPDGGRTYRTSSGTLSLATATALQKNGTLRDSPFLLGAGEEAWAVLALGEHSYWTDEAVAATLEETATYWRRWVRHIAYTGPRAAAIERSAVTVHLLSHAPTGSLVAAPTTSLPERLGGDRNYDYRYAWIRDASLSLAILAVLGDRLAAQRYMDWIATLESSTDSPLQVLYRLDGGTDVTEIQRQDLAGYRQSRPVRFGNHAYQQRQHDSMGYFVDCAAVYLEQGGEWREEYWRLIQRITDYVIRTWNKPDSGIWEMGNEQHYVSSKVMSWVALERAVKIAGRLGREEQIPQWRAVMKTIHDDVMRRGWSSRLGAFRQRYEAETLDASVLLIPVMGFLSAKHPRVLSTMDRLEKSLTRDGLVYRYDPQALPTPTPLPLGAYEGAFLPCTFWLATAYAMAGRIEQADALLRRAEAVAGELGLFSEEADGATSTFLGNMPLVFAQVEYVRAVMEVAKARPLGKLRLMASQFLQRLRRALDGLAEPADSSPG